jgi:hypothetical protein
VGWVNAAGEVKSEVAPVTPCRLGDTRPSNPLDPKTTSVGPGETVIFDVFGTNGDCTIPSGVTAVDVNLTSAGATATSTFIATYLAGGERPTASQLNPCDAASMSASSTSITLSADGQFVLYNNRGTTQVIACVPHASVELGWIGRVCGPVGLTDADADADAADGLNGASGVDGAPDTDGAMGPAGSDGLDGAPVDVGAQGLSGVQGVPDVRGVPGVQGGPGTPGTNGTDGVSGREIVVGAPAAMDDATVTR